MQQVIIVLADTTEQAEKNEEFIELVQATDMEIKETFTQNLKSITLRTYIGIGKCEEIRAYLQEQEIQRVVFNHDLSPLQIRNLEEILQTPVMDRTELILAIFESRAVTRTARLQIECAQLKKLFPRLIGANTQLERQSGSGKNKGAGEKQLELDRRRINARIQELQRELKKIEAQRFNQRRARQKSMLPLVSLVGYTNAGKSTLLNALTGAGVLAEDKLFATLDTTTRAVETQSGANYLFTDTVGFIQKLPHGLIKAFRATLEEAKYADLLVHVVDASNPKRREQMNTVYKTLAELGADKKPIVTVYNKIDKDDIEMPLTKDNRAMETLAISAGTGIGLPEMIAKVEDIIKSFKKSIKVLIPYDKGHLLSIVHGKCEITASENKDEGYYFELYADNETENRLREYIINDRTI